MDERAFLKYPIRMQSEYIYSLQYRGRDIRPLGPLMCNYEFWVMTSLNMDCAGC